MRIYNCSTSYHDFNQSKWRQCVLALHASIGNRSVPMLPAVCPVCDSITGAPSAIGFDKLALAMCTRYGTNVMNSRRCVNTRHCFVHKCL
jgi:hypothetical protein